MSQNFSSLTHIDDEVDVYSPLCGTFSNGEIHHHQNVNTAHRIKEEAIHHPPTYTKYICLFCGFVGRNHKPIILVHNHTYPLHVSLNLLKRFSEH